MVFIRYRTLVSARQADGVFRVHRLFYGRLVFRVLVADADEDEIGLGGLAAQRRASTCGRGI